MGTFDVLIVILYLLGVTLFGLRFGKRERTLKAYFLADRDIPWWAICLSIVAAETSTLTIISVPGFAYEKNFTFLQLVFGYLIGRVVIAKLLLPAYFRGELLTAYGLIEQRFGSRLRSMTAAVFLITRAAAEGVRIFAVSIVVRIAFAAALPALGDFQRDLISIGIVTALTLFYTFEGGMNAVIWTDVVQTCLYVVGALVGMLTAIHLVPGGWTTVHDLAAHSAKFRIFDFSFDFFKTYTFWSGLIGGTFLTTASHGTDQLIVQRLLASRSQKEAVRALLASGVAILVMFSMFLLFGIILFAFYSAFAPAVPFSRSDVILPTFIVDHLPTGVRGLMISAILAAAMSNLSAALNSLSSTTIIDFYSRWRPSVGQVKGIAVSKITTLTWGLVLFALAVVARGGGRVLEVGLAIASVAYGSLLGVFMLGVLSRSARENGAIVGMACGLALNIYLWRFTRVPFTWYVPIGSIATFTIGRLLAIGPVQALR